MLDTPFESARLTLCLQNVCTPALDMADTFCESALCILQGGQRAEGDTRDLQRPDLTIPNPLAPVPGLEWVVRVQTPPSPSAVLVPTQFAPPPWQALERAPGPGRLGPYM